MGKTKISGCKERIRRKEWHIANYEATIKNPPTERYKDHIGLFIRGLKEEKQKLVKLKNELYELQKLSK